jgi:branched-chain amino acid transport system permease protein
MPLQVEIFLETLLNSLTLGGLYALVTLGLALTFSVIDLVNFAHGDLFMIGGYTFFVLINLESIQLPYAVIVVLVILLTALYAVIMERVAIHPIIDKSWRTHAVTTLGLSIILQNAALLIFTSDPKQVPTSLSALIISPLGIRTSVQRLLILAAVVLIFFGLQWFVKRTKLGKTMRAVSQNREMCEVVGIDVRRVALITFAIGGGITGLAAALIAPLFSVYPTMGSLLTLKALAAIVMGGMGQVNGAIYSAFLLGIVESFYGSYVSFAFKDVVSFGLFILVLFARPRGLFGRRIGL